MNGFKNDAIDEKINRNQTQIDQTEQYKKGLLQYMFCQSTEIQNNNKK